MTTAQAHGSRGPRLLPQWDESQPVLHAAHGTGNWIGAASALVHGDFIYLAYRDRHPVDRGRGNRAYVSRSPIDSGVHFDTRSIRQCFE